MDQSLKLSRRELFLFACTLNPYQFSIGGYRALKNLLYCY
jgi:hypothetical protein